MKKKFIQVKLILICALCLLFISPTSIIFAENKTSDNQTIVKKNKAYENHLIWGERFFNLNMNSLALSQYTKAKEINPGAYFPVYRINQIKQRLQEPQNSVLIESIFDFNKSGLLISILIYVIVFSLTSMFFALITVLFNRNKMVKTEKRIQFLKEEYQTLLIDYLFSENTSEDLKRKIQSIASDSFNRKVLINQMIDLSVTITGHQKLKLKELYILLQLEKDSYKKAMSRKWHIKAKGFRELAFMDIPLANNEILKCLSSKNDILRMEAQFAMVRLNPDDSYLFLDNLEKSFTLWEQLNIYETITFHNLKLPDFVRLLESPNKTVVLFSLRMIKVFSISEAYNVMVKLLSNNDPEIRNLTIQVIGSLKISESLQTLKKIYKHETYENCIAIIQAMSAINNESMLNFLKLVLDKEDDVQLQIEAAMAINKIGNKGSETLNKLLQSDYKNYQIIVKHVLDKRIN